MKIRKAGAPSVPKTGGAVVFALSHKTPVAFLVTGRNIDQLQDLVSAVLANNCGAFSGGENLDEEWSSRRSLPTPIRSADVGDCISAGEFRSVWERSAEVSCRFNPAASRMSARDRH